MKNSIHTGVFAVLKEALLMKKIFFIFAGLLCALPWTAKSFALESASEKTLLLYYSRTGNTKAACQALAKAICADSIEVKDLSNRSGGWGFFTGAMNALFNMQTGIEPEHPDLAPYSRIIIASPIWAGRLSAASRTIIARNRFDGKKVLVFSTTNVLEKKSQLEKTRALVEKAGGVYCSHFQVAVTEKLDGSKTQKAVERIVQETTALVPDMEKAFTRPLRPRATGLPFIAI
jgi:flavodoxin